jgi:hypothetical protein
MIEEPGTAGDSMIWLGEVGSGPDMYVHHDDKIAPQRSETGGASGDGVAAPRVGHSPAEVH